MSEELKIHVCGFPRSGTMWLSRLIGDVLNCPIHFREFSEGMERKSVLGVYHCHDLPSRFERASLVLRIVRDPRDVAVSHAKYWQDSIEDCVASMCKNYYDVPTGGWHMYEFAWLESGFNCGTARYEDLLTCPEMEIETLLRFLNLWCDLEGLSQVVEYRSFENELLRQDYHNLLEPREALWKGQAGAWTQYFHKSLGAQAQAVWGHVMRRWGYTQSNEWWESLPDSSKLEVQV